MTATSEDTRTRFSALNASYFILVLAILVSGYLSYLKLSQTAAVCIESGPFDCGTVLNSVYSEIMGIPIAWLGLATNVVVVALLWFENRIDFLKEYGTTIIFAVVLFAFIFSVYLVYLQAFVIGAFCPWCLTHEALITVLFIISSRRMWQVFQTSE